MSKLHIRQVKSYIENTFNKKIDISDAKNPSDITQKIISRGLVALALMRTADISADTAAVCITDESRDNGIDAIYLNENSNTINLVQGKWSENGTKTCEVGDLHKFLKGCKDIINDDWAKFGKKAKKFQNQISNALTDTQVKITLTITYSSDNPLSNECLEIITPFLSEINSITEVCTLKTVGLTELFNTINEEISGKTKDVKCTIFEWGKSDEPFEAITGLVACSDIALWYRTNDIKLFTPNIRSFLGSTEVNNGIVDTLINEPESFWYVNNGITAICNKIDKSALGGASRASGTFTMGFVAQISRRSNYPNPQTDLSHTDRLRRTQCCEAI